MFLESVSLVCMGFLFVNILMLLQFAVVYLTPFLESNMAMDVFHGKIDGFPEISVDYFLGSSLHCSKFFLSHCHTDHIKGLDSQEFKSVIHNQRVKIYCTRVTASLVLRRSKLNYLASSFVYLEKDESYTIDVSLDETFNVAVFDANHCPGSVMFLFSKNGARALYTGDFRVAKDSIIDSAIKDVKINSLYIDTTFFSPEIAAFRNFPPRQESEDAVVRFVVREKELNQLVNVHIDVTPGWENIFVALANYFDSDIQATETLYNQYADVEEIIFYLTLENSWIHINQTNTECTLCHDTTLKLRPSIQWKIHNNMMNNDMMIAAKAGAQNTWYVTHSMHSSYTECCYFIDQVSADKVFPIAIPPKSSNHRIFSLLKKFWKIEAAKTPVSSPSHKRSMLSEPSIVENDFLLPNFETFEDDLSSESDDCANPIVFKSNETKKVGMIDLIHEEMTKIMEKPTSKISTIELRLDNKNDRNSRNFSYSETDIGIHKLKRHKKGKKKMILLSSSSESDEEIYFRKKKSGPQEDLDTSVTVSMLEKEHADESKRIFSLNSQECCSKKTAFTKFAEVTSDNGAHCQELQKKSNIDEQANVKEHSCMSSQDTGIMDRVMSQYFGFDSD